MMRGSCPSSPLWAFTIVIHLLQLTHAFRPTAFLLEKSKYTDDSLEAAAAANNIQGRPNMFTATVPPTVWPTLDAGVMDAQEEAISSRRGFLRDVAGLGVGTVTGALSAPWAANAVVSGDAKKHRRCPPYEAVEDFDIRKYMGIWYELAYYDWTQNNVCGCTRFNMTRTDNMVLDAFTAVCPYGYTDAKTYIINMHEEMNVKTPGSFKEHAFYHSWDNKVVALWRSTSPPGGSESYERAIQMQCMEIFGRRAFVGINFLSRVPIVPQEQLTEMFEATRALGIAEIGGNPTQMSIVPHEGCRYPSSTENVEKLSLGSGLGVNTLAM